jgi:hypothetical protein
LGFYYFFFVFSQEERRREGGRKGRVVKKPWFPYFNRISVSEYKVNFGIIHTKIGGSFQGFGIVNFVGKGVGVGGCGIFVGIDGP